MCKLLVAFLTLLALTFGAVTWAGPIEEVAEVAKPRQQAFAQGNVDAFTAAFADNAVLQSSFSPFRIEGKEAIRAYFGQLFQIYPKRWFAVRQLIARAYGDDLVVQNGYAVLHVIDEKGEPMTYNTRSNTIWKKMDGRWQIIDTHVSRLPGSN
jgi:uncharacterized protein (TIGR02246 family)